MFTRQENIEGTEKSKSICLYTYMNEWYLTRNSAPWDRQAFFHLLTQPDAKNTERQKGSGVVGMRREKGMR